MKNTSMLVTALFAISCSLFFTDCNNNCVPPNPKLSTKTLEWLASFENNDYLFFKNTTGELDSLQVNRTSETLFCGGEECGANNCQYEKAILTSTKNAKVTLSLNANPDISIYINDLLNPSNYMAVNVDADNDKATADNSDVNVVFDNNYSWKGQTLSVLKIDCSGNCSNYEMQNIILSKTKGLIQFTTKDGVEWKQQD